MSNTKTLASMTGRVDLRRGLGDETGTLEVVERQGRRHAYVTTDAGVRVHVPFAPDATRSESESCPGWTELGTKDDHSSGDLVRTYWAIRAA